MTRKIVQFQIVQRRGGFDDVQIVALCDDGSLWNNFKNDTGDWTWLRLTGVPNDDPAPAPAPAPEPPIHVAATMVEGFPIDPDPRPVSIAPASIAVIGGVIDLGAA